MLDLLPLGRLDVGGPARGARAEISEMVNDEGATKGTVEGAAVSMFDLIYRRLY